MTLNNNMLTVTAVDDMILQDSYITKVIANF